MTDPFVPPDWLGKTPYSSFVAYGDPDAAIWYGRTEPRPFDSLRDTHAAALRGDPRSLEIMRLYYVALTTKRLKS